MIFIFIVMRKKLKSCNKCSHTKFDPITKKVGQEFRTIKYICAKCGTPHTPREVINI